MRGRRVGSEEGGGMRVRGELNRLGWAGCWCCLWVDCRLWRSSFRTRTL